MFEKEGNPGNNLLPRIPEIEAVFNDATVKGALISLLGSDYYMQPHRHPHDNPPMSHGQILHQDGGKRWSHLTRRLLVMYYPQNTPLTLGPTSIVPGSHYYNTLDGVTSRDELPICGDTGTVTIMNYDLWHRAMPNRSHQTRYMMKFLFSRMSEPQEPCWHNEQGAWEPGEPFGDMRHQAMFQRVWEWHHGKIGRERPKDRVLGVEPMSKWIEALGDESELNALQAAYVLGQLGEPAVPGLIEKLQNESEAIRRNAYYALVAVGASAVEPLIRVLGDRRWWVRESAAKALGDIGLAAQTAVPALMRTLEDESIPVRESAAEALGTTGQQEPTAVPTLIAALQDENERVRRNATFALARIGRYATDAVEALHSTLSDPDRYVRGDAVHALYCIGTPEATDILLRFLLTSRWCPLTTPDVTHTPKGKFLSRCWDRFLSTKMGLLVFRRR